MTLQRRRLGIKGENIAADYLQGKGYRILERNFRCRLGEIDIIARHKNCLVFVEVRTKSSLRYGLPQESITPGKVDKLRRLALFYLARRPHGELNVRFDVVAVDFAGETKIMHIENAF
ncbi:YraN family protein [Desulfallas sp. Bu1-1]|uniref:YraN family protein n=1 Tax=Desulfallas sp. Bu1-1 TaxID=2787620 RepID=UPI001FAB8C67|nr:YraN family protein [Desulfallas sp. Bu1-1]